MPRAAFWVDHAELKVVYRAEHHFKAFEKQVSSDCNEGCTDSTFSVPIPMPIAGLWVSADPEYQSDTSV